MCLVGFTSYCTSDLLHICIFFVGLTEPIYRVLVTIRKSCNTGNIKDTDSDVNGTESGLCSVYITPSR